MTSHGSPTPQKLARRQSTWLAMIRRHVAQVGCSRSTHFPFELERKVSLVGNLFVETGDGAAGAAGHLVWIC